MSCINPVILYIRTNSYYRISNHEPFYLFYTNMAGQSNHESYTYNIQSDQLHSMDSNCTNDLPSNQTIMDQPIIMDYNGIHSYHTSPQPPGQDSFPSDIGLFDNNGVYIGGVNESLNT